MRAGAGARAVTLWAIALVACAPAAWAVESDPLPVPKGGARERALRHYNRALELKPDLARAYMYRGVLFTQMGDLARARADHARLRALDPHLAARLELVMAGTGRDESDGLTPQYD